jgi:putative acetyltransferase
VIVREETSADEAAIDAVLREAFGDHGAAVVRLVADLRAADAIVPGLALVAEDADALVGYVAFSRAPLAGGSVLMLSPLGVRTAHQRQGAGSALVEEALARAEAAGEPLVVVEGVPAYYPRFGFELAAPLGIEKPYTSIPDDAFMAKRLAAYDPQLRGRLAYPPAFAFLYEV